VAFSYPSEARNGQVGKGEKKNLTRAYLGQRVTEQRRGRGGRGTTQRPKGSQGISREKRGEKKKKIASEKNPVVVDAR
jgi:hypothetical protein